MKKSERFTAEVRDGHRGRAVEVPFDPASKWGLSSESLGPGRRGFPVEVTIDGRPFESAIVPRSRRFYLLLEEDIQRTTGIASGDTVEIVVSPRSKEAAAAARKKRPVKSGKSELERVRAIALALPESSEKLSHGEAAFFVKGKQFVTMAINHHGDGRLAIWCAAAEGAQEALVAADPNRFFVPPYVGGRGWIGIELDRGLSWEVVGALIRDAWRTVAPKRVAAELRDPA